MESSQQLSRGQFAGVLRLELLTNLALGRLGTYFHIQNII